MSGYPPRPGGDRRLKFIKPDGDVIFMNEDFREVYERKGYVVDESEVDRWQDYQSKAGLRHRWHGIRHDYLEDADPPTVPTWAHPVEMEEQVPPLGPVIWTTYPASYPATPAPLLEPLDAQASPLAEPAPATPTAPLQPAPPTPAPPFTMEPAR